MQDKFNKNHIKLLLLTMELSHIEHIGIAVKSLETAIPYYEEKLGLKCYSIEEVKDQKVKTAFFKIGQTKLELLESTDPEGTIAKFIEKRGEGVHHIDKAPRKGAEGLNIAFLHPKSTLGVLTEICEDPSKM